jgi:hypothetical protein
MVKVKAKHSTDHIVRSGSAYAAPAVAGPVDGTGAAFLPGSSCGNIHDGNLTARYTLA